MNIKPNGSVNIIIPLIKIQLYIHGHNEKLKLNKCSQPQIGNFSWSSHNTVLKYNLPLGSSALIQAGRFVFPDTLIMEDKFEWCQVPVSKVLPSNIMKICEKPNINNEIFIKTRLKRQMKEQQTNSIDCTYPGSVWYCDWFDLPKYWKFHNYQTSYVTFAYW